MHVLLITEFQPSTAAVEITGGIEARTHYLAEELRRRGHRVTVIADRSTGERWEYASWTSIPRRVLFVLRTLNRALLTDADIVDATNFVVDPIAWVWGRVRRRPVIFWYPDVWVGSWRRDFGRIGILGEWCERRILRLKVDQLIAISDTVRTKLVANHVAAGKVTMIPCGVSSSLVASVTGRGESKNHDLTVVSRLLAYKDVDVVLRATAIIARARPDLRLSVIGRGPEAATLRRLSDQLGLEDNVTFHGFVPSHADVLDIIARGRVLVTASRVEGFGIVLVEAMALGVPYVATDIPVFREHRGRGGLLFRAGDASDLAAKLALLLNDDELLREKSLEASEHARRYTWERVAAETEALYCRVLGHPQVGRAHRRIGRGGGGVEGGGWCR
jgi:glycosyltransferase involved in cell wall biosynthesis